MNLNRFVSRRVAARAMFVLLSILVASPFAANAQFDPTGGFFLLGASSRATQPLPLEQTSSTIPPATVLSSSVKATYANLPLSFEANVGQTDPQVKFLTRGPGQTTFLTSTGAVFLLRDSQAKGAALGMRFLGSKSNPRVSGDEELPGKVNYFIGSSPKKWRTNVPTYAKVHYQNLYPGIDLVYYGNQRQLEYDLIVQPGSDPRKIVLGFDGVKRLEVDKTGDLVLHTAVGALRQHKPVCYQEDDGIRRKVRGSYVIRGKHQVGFQLGAYDRSRALVIDPVIVYSTYLGGSGDDGAFGLAVDSLGNAYVSGSTLSSDFPTTIGAFDTSYNGGINVFVTKINPTGSALVYSTYLGSCCQQGGYLPIAIDSVGNAYVTGSTFSPSFPTTAGAFDTSYNGGEDAFVSKLDPTGSLLVYSTFLGAGGHDAGRGIAVDSLGNANVAGSTSSSNFPTTIGAFDTSFNGGFDGFVAKLDLSGSTLVYSTYLGGSGIDEALNIILDGADNAYVTGYTRFASDFPTTLGAFDTSYNGDYDAFVTKLNPAGSAPLIYSTYLGGSAEDVGRGIALDSSNNAHVAGYTRSSDFPTTLSAFDTSFNGGSFDAFVTKLNQTGSAQLYSTYLGGGNVDFGTGIAVDNLSAARVAGYTNSPDFPTTVDAFDSSFNGDYDVFATTFSPTGSAPLVYSTYVGGSNTEACGSCIALDSLGNVYVAGGTRSADFPTTVGALDTSFNGGSDAFVVKIGDVALPPLESVVLIIDEDSIDNGNPPNFFSRRDVNDDVAEIGVRAQLRYFQEHLGTTITLHTGQMGDEGWFALTKVPPSWAPAGGLAGYVGNSAANPEDQPPHGTGPGLGAPDANGDRESLLDRVPDVTPLRAGGLKKLEGRQVCAVVYDGDIGINYGPLIGNLKGANLGTVAFEVVTVTLLIGASSSSLPEVKITILDARVICTKERLVLFTDAPMPTSLWEPFDVLP